MAPSKLLQIQLKFHSVQVALVLLIYKIDIAAEADGLNFTSSGLNNTAISSREGLYN